MGSPAYPGWMATAFWCTPPDVPGCMGPGSPRGTVTSRHPWAWLLVRGLAVDVTVCLHCVGLTRLRVVKLATTGEEIHRAILAP